MENALIKKEKDFLDIWNQELIKKNKNINENELFIRKSKVLIKSILEASKSISDNVSKEDFLSIAKVLKVIIDLQENNISSEDLENYIETLLKTTKNVFSDMHSKEIEKFQQILNYLLIFIQHQSARELLLKEEICYLEQKVEGNILSMVGSSKTINNLIKEMKPILDNDVTVLIEGETGTGKELMARAIYNNSSFKNGPFIALNCAAIPEDLMESEMFGYKKGSFTDAQTDKPGKIELANNGILFLDEVNELPLKMQAKLLRVIQEKMVTRIGEVKERKIHVKIICTTNKKLKMLVEEGKFRDDLYYRINVYSINLPPIRKRTEDVLPLAQYFLTLRANEFNKKIKAFSEEARKLLLSYNWPGNIREIDNVVTRAVLKTKREVIDVADLDIYLTLQTPDIDNETMELMPDNYSLKHLEKNHIARVMEKNRGNIQKTAKELGITRATLYSKLKEYSS